MLLLCHGVIPHRPQCNLGVPAFRHRYCGSIRDLHPIPRLLIPMNGAPRERRANLSQDLVSGDLSLHKPPDQTCDFQCHSDFDIDFPDSQISQLAPSPLGARVHKRSALLHELSADRITAGENYSTNALLRYEALGSLNIRKSLSEVVLSGAPSHRDGSTMKL